MNVGRNSWGEPPRQRAEELRAEGRGTIVYSQLAGEEQTRQVDLLEGMPGGRDSHERGVFGPIRAARKSHMIKAEIYPLAWAVRDHHTRPLWQEQFQVCAMCGCSWAIVGMFGDKRSLWRDCSWVGAASEERGFCEA